MSKWEKILLLLKFLSVLYSGQRDLPIPSFVNNLTVSFLSHVKGDNNTASLIQWLGELNELVFSKCLALCLLDSIEGTP